MTAPTTGPDPKTRYAEIRRLLGDRESSTAVDAGSFVFEPPTPTASQQFGALVAKVQANQKKI